MDEIKQLTLPTMSQSEDSLVRCMGFVSLQSMKVDPIKFENIKLLEDSKDDVVSWVSTFTLPPVKIYHYLSGELPLKQNM